MSFISLAMLFPSVSLLSSFPFSLQYQFVVNNFVFSAFQHLLLMHPFLSLLATSKLESPSQPLLQPTPSHAYCDPSSIILGCNFPCSDLSTLLPSLLSLPFNPVESGHFLLIGYQSMIFCITLLSLAGGGGGGRGRAGENLWRKGEREGGETNT